MTLQDALNASTTGKVRMGSEPASLDALGVLRWTQGNRPVSYRDHILDNHNWDPYSEIPDPTPTCIHCCSSQDGLYAFLEHQGPQCSSPLQAAQKAIEDSLKYTQELIPKNN